MVKNMPNNAGEIRDICLIPGLGRSPEGGCGNHKATKSRTQLKQLNTQHVRIATNRTFCL